MGSMAGKPDSDWRSAGQGELSFSASSNNLCLREINPNLCVHEKLSIPNKNWEFSDYVYGNLFE